MKFLLEILGMTNYCNLNCNYCDWDKDIYTKLSDKEIVNLKRNIRNVRNYVDINYPEIQLVEYSGGEPFMYPEVIEEILEIFDDKWIRIITNGLLVKDEHIKKIKNHGRTFVAVSLDGHNINMNNARFANDVNKFYKVLETIDKLVENEIPTMILCTISQNNIGEFSQYISFLEERYSEAIYKGRFVLPAHSVSDYGKDRNRAQEDAGQQFIKFITDEGNNHLLIDRIRVHYENLAYFLINRHRFRHCKLYDWSVSIHFRGREIVQEGNFNSFGCGMRGLIDCGIKNINSNDELNEYTKELSVMSEQFENALSIPYQCNKECFVDWEAFDLILNGNISVSQAEEWFVIFRDEKVKNFIKEYVNLLDCKR